MVTRAKRWPNNAAWARDDAATEFVRISRMLLPLVEGERLDQTETLRRQAVALSAAQSGLVALTRVGARVRE